MENKRIQWIDLLRVVAILFVVLCHCTEGIYRLNAESMAGANFRSEIFALTFFSVGRLGVPLFMLISGYLLLDRVYDIDKAKRFWKNNWLYLLICTYVWIIVYNIYEVCVNRSSLSVKRLLKEFLFMQSSNMNNMWYMPMLLGMYLLFPYVANALKSLPSEAVKLLTVFFSIYAFGYPFLNTCRKVIGKGILSLTLSLGYSGGYYGLYFIIGYFLKKGILRRVKSVVLLLLTGVSFAAVVCFQLWAYSKNYTYNVWYDNPFLLLCAIGFFELVSRIKGVPFYKIFSQLSRFSFAVYLIHNIIRRLVQQNISAMPILYSVKVLLLWAVTVIFSLLVAWLISRIPKIGRYLLYMK